MKDLRDNELFDEFGNRLRNYSEDPDEDVWNKIFVATQNAAEPRWVFRTLYTSAAASMVAFLLLIYPVWIGKDQVHSTGIVLNKAMGEKSKDANTSFIVDESGKVISKNISHLHKTKKSELPKGTMVQNHGGASKIFKNEEEVQHIVVETPIDSDSGNEIRMVNEIVSASHISYDSIKKPELACADSLNVKNKNPVQEKKKKIRSGLDFYASVTPLFSYQKVTPLQNDDITVDKFSSRPVMSGDRFGISFEVGVQGEISKHFEYYGGLSYYQQNQTLSYHYKSGEGTTVESSRDPLHFTVTPGGHNRQVNYDMKNVGAQLGILYYLKGNTLTHKVGAGLSYQQGLRKLSEGDTYDNSKSSYLFYQLFYRTELRLNESMRIFFQPNFSQVILSHEKLNEPFKLKPYRAGLSLGIVYHFEW